MATKIDRAALRQRIKQLEGLTDEERAALMELAATKRYGLVWEEREEAVEERLREQLPVLIEDTNLRITGQTSEHELPRIDHEFSSNNSRVINGNSCPNHILIEGDNLEALTALSYTHEGKVDVIYIDPPYNTGNKDFVYNDSFVDSEDSYRHSKWLSFMSKRLRIAKRLLSDTGVIFISIDDYSFAQLKLLCDDIFETSSNPKNWNFKECLIWNKQHSQQQGTFKRYHEYVFVYAKKASMVGNVLTKGEGIIEAGAMKKVSKKNPASSFSFPAGVKFEAEDGTRFTGTYGDSEKVNVLEGVLEAKDGKTLYPVVLEAGWTQKAQMKSWFDGYETIDTKGQKVIEFYFNSAGKIKCRKDRGSVTPCSILPEFGMGSEQTSHLEDILGKANMFSNPKPVDMIKMFCDWFCPPNGIVLDFFAGSGTTLESTMQLNKEDGGKRQCILVTNNENNICREVTYERNRRVIEGYTTPKGVKVEGLKENNLRYYRTRLLPRERTNRNMRMLVAAATDLLCIKENLFEEVQGSKFKVQGRNVRLFGDGEKRMLVIYNEEVIPEVVEWIGEQRVTTPIKVYVFSPGAYAWDDDFAEVIDRVELCALPEAIYQAYKNVLPKKRADGRCKMEDVRGEGGEE